MRLYLKLLAAAIRGQMQYKFNFIMTTFFYALITAVDFLTVAAILYRYPTIAGWRVTEVALLAGVVSASRGLYRVFGAELSSFEKYLVTGEFDSLLIRPWPPLASLLARNFDLGRVGAALQGYLLIGFGLQAALRQGAPAWVALYVLLLPLVGALIVGAIGLAVAALGFYLTRIDELQTFALDAPLTAANYPAEIFPRWLQGLLTGLLPVTAIGYLPLRYALGKGGHPLELLAPLAAAGLGLAVALRLWRWGERHYQSTGS